MLSQDLTIAELKKGLFDSKLEIEAYKDHIEDLEGKNSLLQKENAILIDKIKSFKVSKTDNEDRNNESRETFELTKKGFNEQGI